LGGKLGSQKNRSVAIAVGGGIAVAIAVATVAAILNNPQSTAIAQEPIGSTTTIGTIEVFAPNSQPYNKTYDVWNKIWWEWAQKEPIENNPIYDPTGEKCAVNQVDPNVWFLAGTTGGRVERDCTIPASKAILLPILNTECSTAEDPSLKTEEALRNCARNNAPDRARVVLKASVDGQEIPNLETYWAESSLYNYTLPKLNIWGVAAGPTQEVAAGYYLMLAPLPPGIHIVHSSGANIDLAGTQTFASEVIYNLTISGDNVGIQG
jgi:hypothetical protein